MNLAKIREARNLLNETLIAAGKDDPDLALIRAARRVVWERHKPGGEWEGLKNAIGELEDIVGCPPSDDWDRMKGR